MTGSIGMILRPRREWRSPRRRRAAGCLLAALMVAACGSDATPPAGSASATTQSAAATSSIPRASPAPASTTPVADTIRVGWPPGNAIDGFRGATFTAVAPSINFGSVVYSGLYRYDAHYNAVPDLADGPCLPQLDPKVIRCRIVATTFHDGAELTAEDVAYSIRLFAAMAEFGGTPVSLKDAHVVDARTIDFVLSYLDPTFLSTTLPTSYIFKKSEVEAAYADFQARSRGLTAKGVQALLDTTDQNLNADPKDCTSSRRGIDALLTKLGGSLYKTDYLAANGMPDPCLYLSAAAGALGTVPLALDAKGLTAVLHAVLGFLPPYTHLVGTGPYRYVSQTAAGVHLEAFAGYHGGTPATRYLDFVPAQRDGSDLESGRLDVFRDLWGTLGSAFETRAAAHGVRVVKPPALEIFGLLFNVRPGRPFSEVGLRRALQLCIDLPRDVDVATGGRGTPLQAGVIPASWAADPDLLTPPRDVASARRLIEESGWSAASDGIYAKGKVRLTARIVVPASADDRVKMADLVRLQANDCGMALETVLVDALLPMWTYPHDIPGTTTPFDGVLVRWFVSGPDPDMSLSSFVSSQVTDPEHKEDRSNFGGFSDAAYDGFIRAAETTYDQPERARLYRQAQEEMATKEPIIWLWSATSYDAVRTAVATADGPVDVDAPNWSWQPERLVVLGGS